MKRSNILSGLALLVSIVSLFIAFSGHYRRDDQKETEAQFQQLLDQNAQAIRAELIERLDLVLAQLNLAEPDASAETSLDNTEFKEIVLLAKSDPQIASMLNRGIESVILREMADELANVDWLDTLSKEAIQKLLTKTARNSLNNGFSNFLTEIDVSDIEEVDGKINAILEEFEGVNSYTHNNALVNQMAAMGDDAIEPLIARLNNGGTGHNWAMKMAITDSLEKLLTEEHEEIILAEFTKTGNLSKLIEKYQFPAAENEVMNKISYPTHGRVDNNVVDAALKMNADRSYPLLIDYVSNGQNVSYAASQLAAEGIDITEPLRMATARAINTWEKAELVELCLDREMPEGYDLAIQVLRSNETHAEHSQKKVYQYIRKYTGLNGSYDEVADWLQDNKPK